MNFRGITQLFNIYIYYELITMTNLVTICHCTVIAIVCIPLCCTLYPHNLFIYNWEFVPLIPLHIFPPPLPSQKLKLSLHVWEKILRHVHEIVLRCRASRCK